MLIVHLSILLFACCLVRAQANICQYDSSSSSLSSNSPSTPKEPCFDVRSFKYTQDRKSPIGSELVLECYVENKSSYTVVWSHDGQFLSTNDKPITPDANVRLDSDGERRFNLVLSSLEADKNGTYECAVVTKSYQRLKYNVDVLVPSSISRLPADNDIVIDEGQSLVVQCIAAGNPQPELTYSRHHGEKGKHVDINNSSMVLTHVDESYAGRYSCLANNGVGEPASSEFQILIRFKPRVRFQEEANVNKNVMYTSQGKVDQIRCIVEGYPQPAVSLTRNGSPISEQLYTYEKNPDAKDQYILNYSIEEAFSSSETFGIYECVATNDLGNSVAQLKITPLISEIKLAAADKHLAYSDAVVFEWSLFSGSPLADLNVQVFSDNGTNVTSEEKRAKLFVPSMESIDETSPSAPAIYHHEAHIVYKGYFDVTKLAANTTYTLRMRAKNAFDVWSEWSHNLTARTSADESQKITKHRSMHHHYRMLHHEKKHKHYQLSGSRDLSGGKRDNYNNANMYENAAAAPLSQRSFSLLALVLALVCSSSLTFNAAALY